jgi:myo-inositol-1(or 4)-monophosphatase
MDFENKVFPLLGNVRERLVANWGTAEIVSRKSKDATDVVTQLDLEVEAEVSQGLKVAFPDIEFVGEEGGGNREAERLWLMDPIDGTAHFVRGMPFCSTMLALVENGKVTFSVIYDFLKNDFYWAELGKGAFKNKERLHVSNRPLSDSFVGWETHIELGNNQQIYDKLRRKTKLFKTIVAGWELAMVASGKLDARVCFDPWGRDYDFAPGSLLITEAGGIVANLGSTSYDYRNTNFIAANPVIYKELTEGPEAIFPI